ncbi:hypothetical protein PAEPH01_1109 [Pancytospora epiphaga]|nr:hypothetical protein PAEPH01_1109 [Pancytospora epiphaga]
MSQRIIAVASGKGGVGKSSVAALIAQIISESQKTLVLDFDICGPSMTTALNATGALVKSAKGFVPIPVSPNLSVLSFGSILRPDDAVIWRGPKKQLFLDLFFNSSEGFDFVIVDTPPGISEEHSFLSNKDVEVIIVSTPQNMALNDTQRCIEFCQKNNMKILGLVENMSWAHCQCCNQNFYPFGNNGGRLLADEYGIQVLAQLPMETNWTETMDKGSLPTHYKSLDSCRLLRDALKSHNIIL